MGKKIYLTIIWIIALLVIIFSVGIRFCGWFSFGKKSSAEGVTNLAGSSLSDTITVDEYKNLKVELGFGEVSFAASDDDSFSVQYGSSDEDYIPTIGVKGDTLYISQKDKTFNGFGVHDMKLTVIVYAPAGFEYNNVDIECGAGDVDVEKLAAKKLDMDYGAGNVEVRNSTIDEIDLDAGAGDVTISGSTFEKLDIDAGAGDVRISGIGDVDQYDYDLDVGVGDIKLDGNKFHGEYKSSGNAGKEIRVDCGVGDLEIFQ